MKQVNKIKCGLGAALLSTSLILTGCNSGGSVPTSLTSNQPPIQQTMQAVSIGAAPTVISLLGGGITDKLEDEVGTMFWNILTKGQAFPPSQAAQNMQLLQDIETQLSQMEQTLSAQTVLIQEIIGIGNANNLNLNNEQVGGYINLIATGRDQVINLMTNILPAEVKNQTLSSFKAESSVGVSFTTFESMAVAMNSQKPSDLENQYSILFLPATNPASLDILEQELSCDTASTPTSKQFYTLSDSTNLINHPIPQLGQMNGDACPLGQYLQNLVLAFTTGEDNGITYGTPPELSTGTNIFYSILQFYQNLDAIQTNIDNSLYQAYILDNVRTSLYAAGENGVVLPLVISPDIQENGVAKFSDAQQELTNALNHRLDMVAALFNQAKYSIFNKYSAPLLISESQPWPTPATIDGPSYQNTAAANCNLNYESLNALSADQIQSTASTAANANNNLLSWDGNVLTTSCQSSHYGQLTTTTDIANLCSLNGMPSYYISSVDGYIRCGTGNYNASNITNKRFNLDQQTFYGTSIYNAPEHFFDEFNSTLNGGTIDPMADYTHNTPTEMSVTLASAQNQLIAAWNQNSTQFGTASVNNNTIQLSGSNNATNDSSWTFVNPSKINISAIPAYGYNDEDARTAYNAGNWIFVDDGVHAFMIGEATYYVNYSIDVEYPIINELYIQCIPGDINCTQGVWQNSTINPDNVSTSNSSDYQGLLFSNGDVIGLTHLNGAQGAYKHGSTTGIYTLYQWYNGTCAPSGINSAASNWPTAPIPWGNGMYGNLSAPAASAEATAINAFGPGMSGEAPNPLQYPSTPFSSIPINRANTNSCIY